MLVRFHEPHVQEDTRFRILWLLEAKPEMSQRKSAHSVGRSAGSYYCLLSALIERGWARMGNFSASADKRRYACVFTPQGSAEKAAIVGRFLSCKCEECDAQRRGAFGLEAELGKPRKILRKPKEIG